MSFKSSLLVSCLTDKTFIKIEKLKCTKLNVKFLSEEGK